MQDRFKFNAIVSSYYDIDTPENYKEFEPKFYLKDVDLFCTGEIGVDYDKLYDTVREQLKDLSEKEIGQIMQHFEDNSNSPECDYVTIRPDKLIQCTGLKDKNGKLIYEGDIVAIHTHFDSLVSDSNEYRYAEEKGIAYFKVAYNNDKARFYLIRTKWLKWNTRHTMLDYIPANHSIAGNIYENPELLEDTECQK